MDEKVCFIPNQSFVWQDPKMGRAEDFVVGKQYEVLTETAEKYLMMHKKGLGEFVLIKPANGLGSKFSTELKKVIATSSARRKEKEDARLAHQLSIQDTAAAAERKRIEDEQNRPKVPTKVRYTMADGSCVDQVEMR